MGVYGKGRPFRYDPSNDSGSTPRNVSGEYRIIDKATKEKEYIGISNDIGRRLKEHKKSGKLKTDGSHYVDWMPARSGSCYDDLREHERKAVRKHKPKGNKSKGGEGRPTTKVNTFENSPSRTDSGSKLDGCLTKIILLPFKLIGFVFKTLLSLIFKK